MIEAEHSSAIPRDLPSRPRAGRVAGGALLWAGVPLFALLTAVGAGIRIPLQPVPITLQTLFVLLAGALLGSTRGSISQSLYLALGFAGIPIFAAHSGGLAALAGPTGGYLAAFAVTPILVGRLLGRDPSTRRLIGVFSLGALLVLVMGTVHLAFFIGGLGAAFFTGFLPFVPGEIAKILAAASIYRSLNALLVRRRN